jgi:hypothetical protein
MPVPKGVHWDLFLGPAPGVHSHDILAGAALVSVVDFGSGTMTTWRSSDRSAILGAEVA